MAREDADSSAPALPDDAVTRLQAAGDLFTSDLSVKEFLLVDDAGYRPAGLVMGSSIYHVGLVRRSWGRNREQAELSQAMYAARELAMDRMRAEAALLGADGVTGVRLDIRIRDWSRRAAEFLAVGTAISRRAEPREAPRGTPTPTATATATGQGDAVPFTSALSGQELWMLHTGGHQPLGLVMGVCVYHVGHRGPGQVARQALRSSEMARLTQGLYDARELAMARMQEEAQQLGADGVVGVHLTETPKFWGSHLIEFLAVGTAVRPVAGHTGLGRPTVVMPLDN